jgi:hypothetical protein
MPSRSPSGSAARLFAEVDGRVHLKLTLLDPTTTEAGVTALVALVAATGAGLDQA